MHKFSLLFCPVFFASASFFGLNTTLYTNATKDKVLNDQPFASMGIKITKKHWHKNKSALASIKQVFDSEHKNILWESKRLKINLYGVKGKKIFYEVYAKTPDEYYYLELETSQELFSDSLMFSPSLQKELFTYVEAEFFESQTNEYSIPYKDFYVLLDTQSRNSGQMLQNNEVNFLSSWGVSNSAVAKSSFRLNLEESVIKNQIMFYPRDSWPKNMRRNRIEVKTLSPREIGFLPLVEIIQPPIRQARYTVKKIDVNNFEKDSFTINKTQRLALPEGHNNGAEWWGALIDIFTSVVLPVGGGLLGAKMLLAGLLVGTSINIVDRLVRDNLDFNQVINQAKLEIDKIADRILTNSFPLRMNMIDFDNLHQPTVSMNISGQLWGEANAARLFGKRSIMRLFGVWSALKSDVTYLIYK